MNRIPFSSRYKLLASICPNIPSGGPILDSNSIPEPQCQGCLIQHHYEAEKRDLEFFSLIDAMVREMRYLEEDIVRWRRAITKYLPSDWADSLLQDIFNNTVVRFDGRYQAYDDFVTQFCGGKDPVDDEQHIARMLRLRDGVDETSIDYLP